MISRIKLSRKSDVTKINIKFSAYQFSKHRISCMYTTEKNSLSQICKCVKVWMIYSITCGLWSPVYNKHLFLKTIVCCPSIPNTMYERLWTKTPCPIKTTLTVFTHSLDMQQNSTGDIFPLFLTKPFFLTK